MCNVATIAVITTGRWDYSHLYYVLKCLHGSDKLGFSIVCPQNHHCLNEMSREFPDIAYLTKAIHSIDDYSTFFDECLRMFRLLNPDTVLVLGDRFEVHAATTAALLLNIPIAHIHGGEITVGAFDNNLRDSITMMSDIHFTSNFRYAENIARMFGKCQAKIFNTGSPGLDWLTQTQIKTREELQKDFPINLSKPYVIACFHPVTKEIDNTKTYIANFLRVLCDIKDNVILILPNIDPENEMIRVHCCAIESAKLSKKSSDWYIVNNLEHVTYLSLMKYASMMIGNSSSGIIEAASFSLPVINIGTRQDGRIHECNVFNCGYSYEDIMTATIEVSTKYDRSKYIRNLYGDGNASKRIINELEKFLWSRWR